MTLCGETLQPAGNVGQRIARQRSLGENCLGVRDKIRNPPLAFLRMHRRLLGIGRGTQ
jgi:hypothetical protein